MQSKMHKIPTIRWLTLLQSAGKTTVHISHLFMAFYLASLKLETQTVFQFIQSYSRIFMSVRYQFCHLLSSELLLKFIFPQLMPFFFFFPKSIVK